MSNLDDYILNIRQLVKSANTHEALDKMLEMGERMGIKSVKIEATLLQGQFVFINREKGYGLLKSDEFYAQLARINYAILALLEQLEEGRVMQPVGSKRDKGRVIHNIPSRMGAGQEFFCSVRIAKDDELLLKNFLKPTDTQPEDIELSRTMEVSLVDPTGGQMFTIRQISPVTEQAIVEDTFTEWDFMVKAIQTGRGILILYVFFIEKIDGQKERRSVSLKRSIEVTSEKVAHYHPWELTNMTTESNEDKGKKTRIPMAAWGSAVAKNAWIVIAALIAGALGFIAYQYLFRPPAPIPETPDMKIKAILNFEKAIQVKTVKVDGNTITGWTTNTDSSSIILPPFAPATMKVEILGQRGNCIEEISLSPQSFKFTMNCRLTQPDSCIVTFVTPFSHPIVFIDEYSGLYNNKSSAYKQGKYKTIIKITKGQHLFNLEDNNKIYECTLSKINANIQSDTILEFICNKKTANNYPVRAVVPNPFGNIYSRSMQIKVDGDIKPVWGDIKPEGLVFNLSGISAGLHKFEVVGGPASLRCRAMGSKIDENNREIKFDCKEFFNIRVNFPYQGDIVKNIKIIIDNHPVSAQNKQLPAGSMFIVNNVEGGHRRIRIEGMPSNFKCLDMQVKIDTYGQQISYFCDQTGGGSFDGVPDNLKPKEKSKSKRSGGG